MMKVSMHLSEWLLIKKRHEEDIESLQSKIAKCSEEIQALTVFTEGNKSTNGYPLIVGLKEQYRQQELSMKEHQAEIMHLKLQLKNLENQRLAELRGKDSVIEGKDKELALNNELLRQCRIETDVFRAVNKDVQEAMDLLEGKGWTMKPGEEKGPIFKKIDCMLKAAEECQAERIELKRRADIASQVIADFEKVIRKAGCEIVGGKLVKAKVFVKKTKNRASTWKRFKRV